MQDVESPESSPDHERHAELQQTVKQAVLALIAHTRSCAFLVDIATDGEGKALFLAFGERSVIEALLRDATPQEAPVGATSVAQHGSLH